MLRHPLIILTLLLLLPLSQAEINSLCTNCATTFGSYCIACSSAAGSCMTGSVYKAATSISTPIQSYVSANRCTTKASPPSATPTATDAS